MFNINHCLGILVSGVSVESTRLCKLGSCHLRLSKVSFSVVEIPNSEFASKLENTNAYVVTTKELTRSYLSVLC